VVFWSRMWRMLVAVVEIVVLVCASHYHHLCSSHHCNLQRHHHNLKYHLFCLVDCHHLSAAVQRIVLDMLKDELCMF